MIDQPKIAFQYPLAGRDIPDDRRSILYAEDDLTESIIVSDVFASGLGRIEDVGGGNARFTCYAFQKSSIFNDRRREKVIVSRVIMPMAEAVLAAKAIIYASEGLEGVVSNILIERRH